MLDHDPPSELTTDPIAVSGVEAQAESLGSDTTPSCPDGSDSGSLSRRELLARGVALGAAGLVAVSTVGRTAHAQEAQSGKHDAEKSNAARMPTALLGRRTGVKVSRLAMGGSWGVDSEVVAVGLEQGINYLDTAESYGPSERNFGKFLNSIGATGHSKERKKLWIVSKTHDHHNLERRLPDRLERLQQDYLDCYYMHQIQDPTLPTSPEIQMAAQNMKKAGKIRFFGFSCHDGNVVECLNAAADSTFIDVVMFRYDYHYFKSDDLNRAIDRCVKAGIGLVAMKTQVGGMTLPDRFNPFKQRGLSQHQAAIQAVAADERITAICSEMTNVDQMTQNAEAVASKLTIAEAEAIREHARQVSHLWCRGCDHLCRAASGVGAQIAVADTLRFLMYHDHYGKPDHARRLFSELPEASRDLTVIANADWHAAEAACPYHVPVAKLMARAKDRLGS
jgi:predicted aldo/keto reductase-like oxidoreductase